MHDAQALEGEAHRRDDVYALACRNDLPTLLSSGFVAMSRNRTPTALPKASILCIAYGHSGESLLTAKSQHNVRM